MESIYFAIGDTTLEQINRILNNPQNINTDFVIHIKSQNELNELIRILEKHKFEIELNLFSESLGEWMKRAGETDKYNTCFRIKNRENDKCVAWNPSIEHWRLYCKDIIELENGEIVFNEGKYTQETAEIEAGKIMEEIEEGGYLKNIYGEMTEEQITAALVGRK